LAGGKRRNLGRVRKNFICIFSALYLPPQGQFCGGFIWKIKGGLAHLVERKHGMFEVIGSSPISSTLVPQNVGFFMSVFEMDKSTKWLFWS
jgi:hypothetical protein